MRNLFKITKENTIKALGPLSLVDFAFVAIHLKRGFIDNEPKYYVFRDLVGDVGSIIGGLLGLVLGFGILSYPFQLVGSVVIQKLLKFIYEKLFGRFEPPLSSIDDNPVFLNSAEQY